MDGRAGKDKMDDAMVDMKAQMVPFGKLVNTFLKSETLSEAKPRKHSAMGGFTYMMQRAEVGARMLAKAWPALEEEFEYIPELAEAAHIMKGVRVGMAIDADQLSQDLVAATTTVKFMAACGAENECDDLVEASDSLPDISTGIDNSAYDESEVPIDDTTVPTTTASALNLYQSGMLLFPLIFC